jgi:dTDP-4-amino-4,6-dideoxygalactose transaminase
MQARRRQIWGTYYQGLQEWAQSLNIRLPVVPEHCEQLYHMFYLLMPSYKQRKTLIKHLTKHGILSLFHYLPLHLSEMGRRLEGREGDCPVTEH